MPIEATGLGARLALGPATLFVLGMAFDWPLAFVGAVFAAMFLQAPAPPSLRDGAKLVLAALGLMLAGWTLSGLLLPFPLLFFLGLGLAVMGAFGLAVRGASPLLVVLALFAALLMPLLAKSSLSLALTVAIWLVINMGAALIVSWAMFLLVPGQAASAPRTEATADPAPGFDPERRLLRMALVTLPFALVFFLAEGGAVLTLLFVAILAQQLAASTADGPAVAGAMLAANLVGGLAAITAHELVVMAPFFPFMALVTLVACLGFGGWHASERSDSGLAGSAMTTFLILFGGAMAPFAESAEVAMLDRLMQVVAALAWVLTAFVVLDGLLPEREQRLPDWRRTLQPGREHDARASGRPG